MNSTKILTLSCYMFPHTRQSLLSHVTVSSGREEMPTQNMPVLKLKVTPTTRLTLLWTRNVLMINSNYWQVSQEVAGQVIPKRRHGTTVWY